MDSSVLPKEEIWFLRVRHHIQLASTSLIHTHINTIMLNPEHSNKMLSDSSSLHKLIFLLSVLATITERCDLCKTCVCVCPVTKIKTDVLKNRNIKQKTFGFMSRESFFFLIPATLGKF
jgi:formate hydrogenlyase subunit 6/NADH:ubiquinone oxidoreductase subunit I